jgi:hypothetical protein
MAGVRRLSRLRPEGAIGRDGRTRLEPEKGEGVTPFVLKRPDRVEVPPLENDTVHWHVFKCELCGRVRNEDDRREPDSEICRFCEEDAGFDVTLDTVTFKRICRDLRLKRGRKPKANPA